MIPSRRITTALLIALFVSGGFTFMLSRRMEHQAALQRQQTTGYAAPAHPLQAEQVLKLSDVQIIAWPASVPVHGGITRVEDVVGRAALYPLEPGRPFVERELTAQGAEPGLASKIPNGMRAIALRSDEIVGVAGFLIPGSHLDVLVTYKMERSQDPVTATVLQNAEVVAAGHQVDPDPDGKSSSVTVVTLLLNPQEAERAVLASTQGSIHFVLRNGTDTSKSENSPLALSELATLPVAAPPPRVRHTRIVSAAAIQPFPVETILGEQSTGLHAAERTQP